MTTVLFNGRGHVLHNICEVHTSAAGQVLTSLRGRQHCKMSTDVLQISYTIVRLPSHSAAYPCYFIDTKRYQDKQYRMGADTNLNATTQLEFKRKILSHSDLFGQFKSN